LTSGEATLELIRLFVFLVGAAALVTLLARRIKLPYTVALVGFGLVAGALAQPLRVEITPQLVLVVLLPALTFEASYQTDFGKLRQSLGGVALLAGPGVFISAALIAVALHFGAGLPPAEAFVVGAMLSATDPAAVIATFKRVGSPRRLATLIEAESVFNDGTGIVLFAIAANFVTRPVGPIEIGLTFIGVTVFSTLLGAAAGFAASHLLPRVGDHLIEISLSVVLAYGTYLAADALHGSGVIATAVAGIVLGNYGRRLGLSTRTEEALDTVWEFVAFLATAFVFLVVGFAIAANSLVGVALPIAWAIIATLAGRAVIVYGLLGGWRLVMKALPGRAGDGAARANSAAPVSAAPATLAASAAPVSAAPATLAASAAPVSAAPATSPARSATARNEGSMPSAWLHVIFWSGLRGAVSTALALSLPADFPHRTELQGITFGVVLFTLVVQATSADLVVGRWGRKTKDGSKPKRAPKDRSKTRPVPAPPGASATGTAEPGIWS
jgi:monovalent cation:H+ antiporter, CPA1 family